MPRNTQNNSEPLITTRESTHTPVQCRADRVSVALTCVPIVRTDRKIHFGNAVNPDPAPENRSDKSDSGFLPACCCCRSEDEAVAMVAGNARAADEPDGKRGFRRTKPEPTPPSSPSPPLSSLDDGCSNDVDVDFDPGSNREVGGAEAAAVGEEQGDQSR